MGKCIGIDLGTTNSCAAHVVNGQPKIIQQPGGLASLPSVYTIDAEGKEVVGEEAKRQAQSNPEQTVMAAKRLIGRNFHSKNIDDIRQLFTYEVVEGNDSEVLVKIRDRLLTLEEISAAILRRLKDQASSQLNDQIESAVITVPAYFNERQRQAVRDAGALAGITVLRIINEPTAAALSYGVARGSGKRIAVYDLGGGTFDMSIIDINDTLFKVLATGGDTFLGGVDFDDRLMQYLLEHFLDEHDIDLSYDRVAVQRIRDAAEEAKIKLSTIHKTRVHIPFITQSQEEQTPIDLEVPLNRKKLEQLTVDLVERSLQSCQSIMKEAKTNASEIDELLLVGGQSKMPLIRKNLEKVLQKAPVDGVNPDEAVALGAALMAHAMTSDDSTLTLLDVLPIPIGIRKSNGQLHILFPKNVRLPVEKVQTLTTFRDQQSSIALRLYQGEEQRAEDNELLGSYVFSGFPLKPKGQVKLKVHFQINSEGLLNLSATDKETGEIVQLTVLSQSSKADEPPAKEQKEPPSATNRNQSNSESEKSLDKRTPKTGVAQNKKSNEEAPQKSELVQPSSKAQEQGLIKSQSYESMLMAPKPKSIFQRFADFVRGLFS